MDVVFRRHENVLSGTLQSGKIQIFDIGAGLLLESIEAHAGAVWSLSLAPNKVGFDSASEGNHS